VQQAEAERAFRAASRARGRNPLTGLNLVQRLGCPRSCG